MITVTPHATEHIADALRKRGKGIGIRLGVKTSGCSGLSYVIEFAEQARPDDTQIKVDDTLLLIDAKSLPHLTGMTLDYTKEGLSEGFRFDNPNVGQQCGCGSSFTPK